jgi:hypothetical protein
MDTSLWWLTTLAKNPSMLSEAEDDHGSDDPEFEIGGANADCHVGERGAARSMAGKGGSDGRLKNSHNRVVTSSSRLPARIQRHSFTRFLGTAASLRPGRRTNFVFHHREP